MSLQWDDREFTQTLRVYAVKCQRTLPEILNKKLFFIARGAQQNTPIGSRERIERSLMVTGYELRRTKSGKRLRKGKAARGGAILASPLVYKLINAARRKKGLKGLRGAAMKAAVAKFLAGRVRSIGTQKRGWNQPIGTLARAAHEAGTREPGKAIQQAKGKATPAKDGWNPVAELMFELNLDWKGKPFLDPKTVAAVAGAFRAETASMEQYLVQRMQKDADAVSAK
ncbi:MAG TPA: hypothetical protein VNT99_08250 [Methylomirabilota bacterium]|nr:hypothetical protein [Methylomirabilota bacterium]